MKLWLVRHAQPLIAEGLCYGQLDIAADPSATEQAAKKIAPLLPQQAMLYCSALQRAQQLAQALHELRHDLILNVDPRLNEMNFGTWEGIAWDAIPQTAFDTWLDDFDAHRFGNAQSVRDVLTRTYEALNQCSAYQNVVWVTHAGVIRAVNYLKQFGLSSLATSDKWPAKAPAFGEHQCLSF